MPDQGQQMKGDAPGVQAEVASRLELENRFRSGANWFYWIAVMSIVNSVVIMMNGEWSFIIGLGATQVVDAIAYGIGQEAPEARMVVTAIAVGFNLIAVSVCALFGFLAGKKMVWAFWLGMAIYALDGLIFLPFGDFLSFGFHLFALFCIFSGLRALNEMESVAPAVPVGGESAA